MPRASLTGYVKRLVNAIFVSGDTVDRSTLQHDRQEIDKLDPQGRYDVGDLPDILAPKQFDPAALIEEDVLEEAHRLTEGRWLEPPPPSGGPVLFGDLLNQGGKLAPPTPRKAPNVMLWLYLPILYAGVRDDRSDWEIDMGARAMLSYRTLFVVLAALLLHLAAMRLADRARRKVTISLADVWLLPLPLLGIPLLALIRPRPLLLGILYAGSLINVLFRARSTGGAGQSDMRQRLRLARDYIEREMLHDCPEAWLPYAIAFGLGDRVRSSAEQFAACGGVARWNELAGAFLRPFVSRSLNYD